MILAIRTDKQLAELYVCNSDTVIDTLQWEAHRQLADTIHTQIETLLYNNHKAWEDISGIIVFKGSGSFTGLRIGITVANTIAYSLQIPIIGKAGEGWLNAGLEAITHNKNDKIVIPEYGGDIHITTPKK